MSSKYNSALYAGFGGGVLIAFLMAIAIYLLMVGLLSSIPAMILVALIAGILLAILLVLTGMMAVSMASKVIKERGEAREVSVNSGLLAGLIGSIVLIILSFMIVLQSAIGVASHAEDLVTLQNTTCICTPALIIFSIIASTLGGLTYYRTKMAQKPPEQP